MPNRAGEISEVFLSGKFVFLVSLKPMRQADKLPLSKNQFTNIES